MEKKKKGQLKSFLPYYKPYRATVALDLFCAALSTVCELVFPMMVREITARAANGSLIIETVLTLSVVYLFLRLIDTVANYYMAYIGHIMGTKLETDMRRDLFAHLQTLSFSYYDDTKVGQIMARVTSDLFDITEFAHHCPEEFFIGAIKLVGAFVILAQINIWLTLVIFAVLPFMLLALLLRKKMKAAFKEQRRQIGEMNAIVEDSLLGVRVVKSFANEDIEQEKFDRGNKVFFETKCRSYRWMAAFQSTTRLFDGVMYVIGILLCSLFMLNGLITGSDMVAYILYISTLLATVRRIIEFTEQFQRGITGIERFNEIMDEPPEITDRPGAAELQNVEGEIRFENVGFHYSDGLQDVLSGIDLEVKKGESVAVVGSSGSGKTTMCSLIPRFYDTTAGRILIDGRDIRDFTQHSLRRQIGVVQQDVYLFAGTVAENILYGRPGASRDEMIEAAKSAGAHDFIMKLPKGYDTYVGERGVKLSGGEKQRISIARLFLKDPPILILDEATSALDNESEMLVQKSLERLAKNRTVLTIAHRLTTIRSASRIIVLTEDGIAESGTHSELLAKGGIYAGFYKMYQ